MYRDEGVSLCRPNSIPFIIHHIYSQFSANCYISGVPTVEMLPNLVRNNLEVEVLNRSLFHLVKVGDLWLQQILIFNAAWSFVEKL